MAASAAVVVVHDRALGREEGAEHFGEQLHAFAGADPGVGRRRVDVLSVVHVHVAARAAAVDADAPVLAVEDVVDGVAAVMPVPAVVVLLLVLPVRPGRAAGNAEILVALRAVLLVGVRSEVPLDLLQLAREARDDFQGRRVALVRRLRLAHPRAQTRRFLLEVSHRPLHRRVGVLHLAERVDLDLKTVDPGRE